MSVLTCWENLAYKKKGWVLGYVFYCFTKENDYNL